MNELELKKLWQTTNDKLEEELCHKQKKHRRDNPSEGS
jgi:hypothetical protein